MSDRALRRGLLTIVGISVVMESVSLILALRAGAAGVETYDYVVEGSIGSVLIVVLTLLLVARRPDHPITWAFVATGIAGSLQQLLGGYAVEALTGGGGLPAGREALTASVVFQSWFVMLFLVLIALFPTGKPISGWLGRVVWLFPLVMLLAVYDALISPVEQGSITYPPLIDAPPLGFLSVGPTGLLIVGMVAQVVVRYIRSAGVERQQLKWFVFTFVSGVVVLLLPWSENDTVGTVVWTLVPVSVVASIAVAILRYRLYEIDRIISRTVTYSVVIGILGLMVLGLVTLLTFFLPTDDPLVVAAATLAAAALFNPLRLRVQRLVERRFNRSRYDAQQVIDGFSSSLQERVEPESVVDGWVGVVEGTMQPVSVGVWVK
jgi:hypothetical protein